MLDAALHAVILAPNRRPAVEGSMLVPFSWQQVSLHAAGAAAVRARIVPVGQSAVSIELADGLGLPVLSVASMVARPVTDQQLLAAVSIRGPGPALRGRLVGGRAVVGGAAGLGVRGAQRSWTDRPSRRCGGVRVGAVVG